jgi:flagellar biosynthesis/type III secretory pathway M-ring protein FliF/YscJ
MNALRARIPDSAPPMPSEWEPVPASPPAAPKTEAVVPSTSRLSGKVRGLVERHPGETLSVLRRWMEEKNRGA